MKAISKRLSSLVQSKRKDTDPSEKSKEPTKNTTSPPTTTYPPPLPPLLPVSLPHVLPPHHYNLADQGWTTLTFPSPPTPDYDLQTALSDLLLASQSFFNKPQAYKSTFLSHDGSEEGFSIIPGEKEFLTLREVSSTPVDLQAPVAKVWSLAADILHSMLGRIAESLDLPADVYQRYSAPCLKLDEVRRGTMLRLFRYENTAPKTVAEPHCDLGLLSMVVGDTPGLEVWNRYQSRFVPVEQTYGHEGNKASVLVGRQLERFTNGRYVAGGHRVVAYDSETLDNFSERRLDPRYRFSIVFVLRADWGVEVDTDVMTSDITGEHREKIKGEKAGVFFKKIQRAHFNINIGHEERTRQKEEMVAKRRAEMQSKEYEDQDRAMLADAGTG